MGGGQRGTATHHKHNTQVSTTCDMRKCYHQKPTSPDPTSAPPLIPNLTLPAGPSMSTAVCGISTTMAQLLMRAQPGSRHDLTFH